MAKQPNALPKQSQALFCETFRFFTDPKQVHVLAIPLPTGAEEGFTQAVGSININLADSFTLDTVLRLCRKVADARFATSGPSLYGKYAAIWALTGLAKGLHAGNDHQRPPVQADFDWNQRDTLHWMTTQVIVAARRDFFLHTKRETDLDLSEWRNQAARSLDLVQASPSLLGFAERNAALFPTLKATGDYTKEMPRLLAWFESHGFVVGADIVAAQVHSSNPDPAFRSWHAG